VIPLESDFIEPHVTAEQPESDAPSRVHLRDIRET
jgi:hypothetical protein